MFKKIILLLLVSSIAVCGFAQKSKQKSKVKSPKNIYFEMLINGKNEPADRYCPGDSILFSFTQIDTSINDYTFKWYDNYHTNFLYTDSITLTFPYTADEPDLSNYKVSLFFEITTDTVPLMDTLSSIIKVGFASIVFDTTVCRGRDITIPMLNGDTTLYNVETPRHLCDVVKSSTGCDTLVCWHIAVNDYIIEKHKISSCDSVIWGNIIVRRSDMVGDSIKVERIFPANDPDTSCDTLKILTITIIDSAQLIIDFNQQKFCERDDAKGTIELQTNFTAFDWIEVPDKIKHPEIDTTYTVYEPKIDIDYSGWYYVTAYMDTSLYEILTDLKIVNCELKADTVVNDCDLIIPDVFTPNGDGTNDYFGIRKLNPKRENDLTVYDRWGRTVFHQKNYRCVYKGNEYLNIEDAFIGLSRGGQKLPDGTYYYAFKYDALPKGKVYTGTLLILSGAPK
jgi:gliding motility-associated-like protein